MCVCVCEVTFVYNGVFSHEEVKAQCLSPLSLYKRYLNTGRGHYHTHGIEKSIHEQYYLCVWVWVCGCVCVVGCVLDLLYLIDIFLPLYSICSISYNE